MAGSNAMNKFCTCTFVYHCWGHQRGQSSTHLANLSVAEAFLPPGHHAGWCQHHATKPVQSLASCEDWAAKIADFACPSGLNNGWQCEASSPSNFCKLHWRSWKCVTQEVIGSSEVPMAHGFDPPNSSEAAHVATMGQVATCLSSPWGDAEGEHHHHPLPLGHAPENEKWESVGSPVDGISRGIHMGSSGNIEILSSESLDLLKIVFHGFFLGFICFHPIFTQFSAPWRCTAVRSSEVRMWSRAWAPYTSRRSKTSVAVWQEILGKHL